MFEARTTLRAAVSAIALSLAMAGGAAVPALAQGEVTVSPEVGEPLTAANAAMQAGDFNTALAEADRAAAVAEKTPEEVQVIEQMRSAALVNLRRYGEAAVSVRRRIDAGSPDARTLAKLESQLYYNAGDKARSAQLANQYIAQYGADADLQNLLAAVANDAGDPAQTARVARQAIAQATGAPDEQMILLLLSAGYELGDADIAEEALGLLVQHYPSPDYWEQYIELAQASDGFDTDYDLDVYRLKQEAGIELDGNQRIDMAEIALVQGLPGEAVRVLEEGFANGSIDSADERLNRLLANAKEREANDKAGLAALEAEAAAAATGQASVAAGEAYLAYGDYAKAAQLIQAGIAKGGVTNQSAARLHLGLAQYKSGNAAGADATWGTVNGADGSGRLARVWRAIT